MRITYVGHATVLIEGGGARVVTDPVLLPRVLSLRRIVPAPRPGALPRPDAVLISHAHFDHLHPASLRLLAPCPAVGPRGCRHLLERAGLFPVTEAAPGQQVGAGSASVTAVLLDHDGRRHPLSRARQTLGYDVEAGGRAFFAGDTGLFDGLRSAAGALDVALLPIWGWGPRLGRGHMGPENAAAATAMLSPRVVIPIHWGTLASRRAPWMDDPRRPAREFAREVASLAPSVEVRILDPGQTTEVGPSDRQ